MYNIKRLDVQELQPGMILADPYLHPSTGANLIAAGTVISAKMVNVIKRNSLTGKCTIYVPENNFQENQSQQLKLSKPSKDNRIPKSESYIKSAQIYDDTFNTVKSFYSQVETVYEEDLFEIKKSAERIANNISENPQILLHIVTLKEVDEYTFSHAVHVSIYASMLAKFLNYTGEDIKEIALAGLLHDIGKIDIPLEIINKPSNLTSEEYKIVQQHVYYSYQRLSMLPSRYNKIQNAIFQHHEKMDGTGYPLGLKGKRIGEWAQILAVADIYDAVTTNRSYRKPMTPHEGIDILKASKASHLDDKCVELFINNVIIYPLGSRVLLNNGQEGTVISLNRGSPSKPVLRIKNGTVDLSKNIYTYIIDIVNY